MDHVLPKIQGTMAFTDLFQVPLVLAIVYSVKLSRRWGRAWKGIGVAFAAYAAWVIATALLVAFSPSGYLLLTLGTLLDPVEPMWKATSGPRIWVIGAAATMFLFWVLPTGVAWLLRRKESAVPRTPSSRPWSTPAVAGLLLLASQQLLLTHARRLDREWQETRPVPLQHRSAMAFGLALALTVPIVVLLVTAATRWLKLHRARRSAH